MNSKECYYITKGAHYLEPPYQLYPWVNPVPYLFIFRTEMRRGFFNFPWKLADVRTTPLKKMVFLKNFRAACMWRKQ